MRRTTRPAGVYARVAGLCLLACCQWLVAEASTEQKHIWWGDLHVHTSFSMDAYVFGNNTTPQDAYRFAKGLPVIHPSGKPVRLGRALDFAAVTDHAEYFGLMQVCRSQPKRSYCADLAEAAAEQSGRGFRDFFLPTLLRGDRNCQVPDDQCRVAETTMWAKTIDAAEGAYEPGKFTTFVATEWSPSPGNLHWHRNLIYATSEVPVRALNSFDEPTQRQLWQTLERLCPREKGCDAIAIPHNTNLGLGGSFVTQNHDDAALALRARFERLVEIHQHKGASECFPGSLLSDEACGFENMLPIPLAQTLVKEGRGLSEEERLQVASGYVRQGLAKGLRLQRERGINAFRYGFVGATDSHSGLPGDVAEATWSGSIGTRDATDDTRQQFPLYNPGGLTGVWAEQNTRASIFAALKRREVFATSGPRIRLRFRAHVGEATIPMGGSFDPHSEVPTFSIDVEMDEVGVQRVDLVKLLWRDGGVQQTLTTLAANPKGKATFNLTHTDRTHQVGDVALWYVRVLQLPTPRWDGKQMVQERAWSSPIWAMP